MTKTKTAAPEGSGVARIELMPRLDLSTVGELTDKFREASGDIQADASKVTHIGALGLQVLISASRSVQARGCKFEITGLGEKPLKQMHIFGILPENIGEAHGPIMQSEPQEASAQ